MSFISNTALSQLSAMRNMLQHLEEDIYRGNLTENHDLMLLPTGPLSGSGDDTIRLIDRLRLGESEIAVMDLAAWLNDMSVCVGRMADFLFPV
jgi:hypothetical protein